jgi:hypothetical protein
MNEKPMPARVLALGGFGAAPWWASEPGSYPDGDPRPRRLESPAAGRRPPSRF